MPKKLLEDMVKINIQKNESHIREDNFYHMPKTKTKIDKFQKEANEEQFDEEERREELNMRRYDSYQEPRKNSRFIIWFIAVCAIVFMLFSFSFLFAKAKIIIKPKIEEYVLNKSFEAVKDATQTTGIPFNVVVISGEEKKTMKGDSEKEVEQNAEGKVMIYNNFSDAPQRLAIDTRLEGSNGKIYKTKKEVSIPGKNPQGVPGSIEVGIYGSMPGEAYNSAPLDFKIFGFKGTPKYDKFYARSIGKISGGFKGRAQVVSELDKSMAISELKDTLEKKLLQNATEQIPKGFVMFNNAYSFSVDEEFVDVSAQGAEVPVRIKGTLSGMIFKEEDLTKKITEELVKDYDESPVFIEGIKDLQFSFGEQMNLLWDTENISFNLKGDVKIVWQVDQGGFVSNILGKNKSDFTRIIKQYPNISSAELVLRPLWSTVLPKKAEDVEVNISY